MKQNLDVSLSIPVPEGLVIISEVELKELQNNSLKGVYWSMRDLEKRINKKQEWIKKNILLKQEFKKEIDVEYGGFVYYPDGSGQSWSFQATKMAEFLEDNFHKIFVNRR
ncbi:DUF771 domain-containing protein [Oceanobacillus kimchii]|uniref:DUF771 domain-containing protein n=1 Tax=Oceanobacillus kimchii TaxID=746691 RepID=UPI0021A8B5AC|nr:DUF771 domain-containing protein [Oceanobacillus kimchii]MCT1577567.1 DUF771 domain-containing protein [Oceanobacillus kimchii]MCT2136555.1 DUF771 domain-containing protein [Oceanobacillus kimchii]